MNTKPIYNAIDAENYSGARDLLRVELESHSHHFKVSFAIICAKLVLHIYEDEFPDDKRPRLALEAAEAWVADPSEKNRKAVNAAARAAADASNASTADAATAAATAAANAAANASSAATVDSYAATSATFAAARAAYAIGDNRKSMWHQIVGMYENMIRKQKLSQI